MPERAGGAHPPGRELNKFGEGLNLGEAVCTCDVLCISVAYKISKRSTRVMTKMVITVIRQQQAKRRRDKGSHRHLSWAPAGMGKRGHLIPLENVVKCFCAIVVTAKHSVDELFMYYFYNLSPASVDFASRPPSEASLLDSAGGFSSPDP